MTTPVLDGLLDTLQGFLEYEVPAVKYAAIKTMIELMGERPEVTMQLLKLLLDPAKMIRDEAKRGLALFAGQPTSYSIILFN